jgi:glycosyltransferase involved in cell wall biosynthesis
MNSLSEYILSLHPRKVAVIASMYPPYPEGVQQLWGGTEIDIEYLVRSLHNSSVQTDVISLHYIKPHDQREEGITRIGTYTPYVLSGNKKSLVDFTYKELFRPIFFLKLIRALKKDKPDVVVIGKTYQFSLAIYVACLILHLPYIVRYDWSCPAYPKEVPCTIRNAFDCPDCFERTRGIKIPKLVKSLAPLYFVPLFFLKRYFWNRSIKVSVVSQFYRQVGESFGIYPGLIEVAPPKSQLRAENREIQRLKSLYKKENTIIILFIGRIELDKGILLLLEAFELPILKNEDIKLLIVGTGNLESSVHAAAQRDSRIEYIGLVPHAQVGNYFSIADLVVVPSIVPEAYGLVASEAVSLNKPVIGFEIGGLKEIFNKSENGFLVKGVTAEGLAQKISWVIDKIVKLKDNTPGD